MGVGFGFLVDSAFMSYNALYDIVCNERVIIMIKIRLTSAKPITLFLKLKAVENYFNILFILTLNNIININSTDKRETGICKFCV